MDKCANRPSVALRQRHLQENLGVGENNSYLFDFLIQVSGDTDMPDNTEVKIKQDLFAEIQNLEQNYTVIKGFTAGKDYDSLAIGSTLQAFKDSLSRASAYVLALYNLKGKRVTIPWEPLFTSLDYALATLGVSSSPKQKAAVRTILCMSQEQLEQVLSYFAALKESIK